MRALSRDCSDNFKNFGGGVRSAIAEFLESEDYRDLAGGLRLKFLSEALIATTVDGKQSEDLHAAIGARLFGPDTIATLLANPLSLSSFAIPLAFVATGDAHLAALQRVFVKFHAAGTLAMPNYPQYRNLELDFAAQRIRGEGFFLNPFRSAWGAVPWLTRDHVYGLTHIHFYNSDFGRRIVRYPGHSAGLLEVMIALAQLRGDDDLMLELIICYATAADAKPDVMALHDRIASELIEKLGPTSACPKKFGRAYHPCFVAWLYGAARRSAVGRQRFSAREEDRSRSLRIALAPIVEGDPFSFLSAYADYCRTYGPHSAIEPSLALFGEVMSLASRGDRTINKTLRSRDL